MSDPDPAPPNSASAREHTSRGVGLTLFSAACAALYFIPFKLASSLAPRGAVVFAAMLVAAVVNTLLSLRRATARPRLDRITSATIVVLGVLTVIGNLCIAHALVLVDAGATSVLLQTQILLVALGGWLLLGERLSARFIVGAGIVLAGLAVMQRPGVALQEVEAAGLLWAMGGTVNFALMTLWIRYAIHSIEPVFANAGRLWLAVALLLALPGTAGAVVELDARVWLLCAAAGLAGPVISRLAVMYALRHVTASRAALIGLSTPVVAFALDYLLLDVVPQRHQLLGAAVILLGLGLPVAEMLRPPSGP